MLVAVVVISSGVVGYRTIACSSWQDDHKRFIYTEMIKISPITYGPEDIDAIISERPEGCARPTELSDEDFGRFRDEGVGPNHFRDRMRATT